MSFRVQKDIMVPMRDGVRLAADAWIRLEVSKGNFPRFDRNTNTGGVITEDGDEDVRIAVNRIWHGPGRPSRLVLPVIDR